MDMSILADGRIQLSYYVNGEPMKGIDNDTGEQTNTIIVPLEDSQYLLNPTQDRFGPIRNFSLSNSGGGFTTGYIDNVMGVYMDYQSY